MEGRLRGKRQGSSSLELMIQVMEDMQRDAFQELRKANNIEEWRGEEKTKRRRCLYG